MIASLTLGDVDPHTTLRPLAYFGSDPTVHLSQNRFSRATQTPDGPATLDLRWQDGVARVEMWGDGISWLRDHLAQLVGLDDDIGDFKPTHQLVARLWREFRGLRMCASHTLWHDTVWLIPGQRVATVDAARQWGVMTRRLSEAAPGPLDLLLPPAAPTIAASHYTDFHHFGIERKRAENLRSAGRYIPRFEKSTELPPDELRHKLELIPGVGPWTSTNLLTMTAGHADEVVLGDYGIPSMVTWALAGERVGTDARMLELLEPFRPHRWRVCRLLMAGGLRPPRHGPRQRNPRIQDL